MTRSHGPIGARAGGFDCGVCGAGGRADALLSGLLNAVDGTEV